MYYVNKNITESEIKQTSSLKTCKRLLSYPTLTERQDGGGIVQLLSADHRLHVEDLAAHALHQHREEVGVGEVQRALAKRKEVSKKGAKTITILTR